MHDFRRDSQGIHLKLQTLTANYQSRTWGSQKEFTHTPENFFFLPFTSRFTSKSYQQVQEFAKQNQFAVTNLILTNPQGLWLVATDTSVVYVRLFIP